MKRSSIITLACGAALILGLASTLIFTKPRTTDELRHKKSPDTAFARANWAHLGTDALVLDLNALQSENTFLSATTEGLLLASGEKLAFSFNVPANGEYMLALTFRAVEFSMLDNVFVLETDDLAIHTLGTALWVDATTLYTVDASGNEKNPAPTLLLEHTTDYLRTYDSVNKQPAVISLSAGQKEFTITNTSIAVYIDSIALVKKEAVPTYDEYFAQMSATHTDRLGGDLVLIEGEDYSVKSDSFINGRVDRNLAVTPYDTYRALVNILNDKNFLTPGQRVLWDFTITEPGFYKIALNSAQKDDQTGGSNVFRSIQIDGQTLFTGMDSIRFRYGDYNLNNLGTDDNDYLFYLEAGRHTLTLGVTTGEGEAIINELEDMMRRINDIGIDLKKLAAGATNAAGEPDKNRTWEMSVYLPHVVPELRLIHDELIAMYDRIWAFNGDEPSYANDLLYAADTITKKLLKDTRNIPNRVDLLSEGDTSISAALGGVLTKITRQLMSLDKIVIYGTNEPQLDKGNFLVSFAEKTRQFVRSFMPSTSLGTLNTSYEDTPDTLQVWVNRPLQYTQILRNMAEAGYTNSEGFDIQISYINDLNKLILSNASGTNPDVVVGMQYDKIFDFALRGAALDLTQFPDFIPFYSELYGWNSLVPTSYDGKVYGAVDTNNLRLMFYRTDIFDSLGLKVPDTWDDVHELMPQLLRYSMNFNIPMSNEVGYKSLDMTGSFFFQQNAEFYSEDGTSTTITSENAVKGFTEMTDIFNIYGVRQQVPNFFNSFRYGEVPIGIGDVDTYTQLSLAAPELAGKWDVALIPGVMQADGTVARDYPVSRTACMIFNNTDKASAAYDFLKWWLQTDTQVQYAYNLQSTYGPAYYWNPANREAMAQLYYKPEHLAIMLEQWEWGHENIRHPATYMVERALSDAWTNVVVNSNNKMVSLDYASIIADREIVRKLVEFGYMNPDGSITEEYITDTVERLKSQLEVSK